MGFRFQRRIRIGRALRLNLSKSGIGASVGRPGVRFGIDAARRKYFSIGIPGSGLSYREFFGKPVSIRTLQIAGALLGVLGFIAILVAIISGATK